MRLAKKYGVPQELALRYEFVNSWDGRSYVEQGEPHVPADELETPPLLERWMQERGLLPRGESIAPGEHRRALELRTALRSLVEGAEDSGKTARERLNRVSQFYPLVVRMGASGIPELQPEEDATGLGRVLAEFLALGASGRLDRLKMCSSEECRWIFFDRSKPGSRRWCSSLLCGNRQKTREYRKRQKADLG